MAHTGRRNPVRWLIRARTREQRTFMVHGGTKIGRHSRRVESWSKWRTHRMCPDVHSAILQLEIVRNQLGLAQVAVWHDGKIVEDPQLKRMAAEDIERREGAE